MSIQVMTTAPARTTAKNSKVGVGNMKQKTSANGTVQTVKAPASPVKGYDGTGVKGGKIKV